MAAEAEDAKAALGRAEAEVLRAEEAVLRAEAAVLRAKAAMRRAEAEVQDAKAALLGDPALMSMYMSAQETLRSAHETLRSAHETLRSAHETLRFAHETLRSAHSMYVSSQEMLRSAQERQATLLLADSLPAKRLKTSLLVSSEAVGSQLQEFRNWFPSEGLPLDRFVVQRRETCLAGLDSTKVALRWLSLRTRLKREPSVLSNLGASLKKRRQEKKPDLEPPEYPLLECILQQAVSGQNGIKVERLTRAANQGEDVTVVVEGNKGMPIKVKPALVKHRIGDAWSIVEANCEVLSQEFNYLKDSSICAGKWSGQGMIIRAQFIFVTSVEFNEWHRVSSLRIAPSFPSQSDTEDDLLPLYNRDSLYHTTDVDEVMGLDPSPGFVAAVKTLEELCQRPIAPLAFLGNENGYELDITVLSGFLHNGRSSVVVPCGQGSTLGRKDVLKISTEHNIRHEVFLHSLLDEIAGIRKMVDHGRVEGAGDGLWFLRLDGIGEELTAEHVGEDGQCMNLANQAAVCLQEVHFRGCLHRDIKPGNMVVLGGQLKLNDFDLSCVKESSEHNRAVFAGTRFFAAPVYADYKGSRAYQELDDWVSLALTFLYLKGVYADPQCRSESKMCALRRVEHAGWAPAQLKLKVREYLTYPIRG